MWSNQATSDTVLAEITAGVPLAIYTPAMSSARVVSGQPKWVLPFAVAFATLGVATVLVIAFLRPELNDVQWFVLRVVLALSGAALASVLPGLLRVEIAWKRVAIRATGGLALFVLIYQFDPPRRMGLTSATRAPALAPPRDVVTTPASTRSADEAMAAPALTPDSAASQEIVADGVPRDRVGAARAGWRLRPEGRPVSKPASQHVEDIYAAVVDACEHMLDGCDRGDGQFVGDADVLFYAFRGLKGDDVGELTSEGIPDDLAFMGLPVRVDGKLNAALVRLVRSHIPDPADLIRGTAASSLYDEKFKDITHCYAGAYATLQKDGYLEANGARLYAQLREHDHSALKRFGDDDCIVHRAMPFWVRRHKDLTIAEVWSVLERVLQLYDSEYLHALTEAHDLPDARTVASDGAGADEP